MVRHGAALAVAAIAAAPSLALAGLVVTANAPGSQSTLVSGATTYGFENLSLNTSYTTSGAISGFGTYTATSPGFRVVAADQYGGSNQTRYMAVGAQASPTVEVTLTLTTARNYIGIYWPAGDANNYLDIYTGSTLLASYSLGRLNTLLPTVVANNPGIGSYNGNPNTGANANEPYAYVNFFGTDGTTFNKLVFRNTSTGTGFETDNHSIATGAAVTGLYLEKVSTSNDTASVSGWVTPTLDLGAVHVNGDFATKTAYVDNTGAGTGYNRGLYATATVSGSASFTVANAVSGLMPDALPLAAYTVDIVNTATAGLKTGTISVDYQRGADSGIGTTQITPDGSVAVSGMVYSGQSTWIGTTGGNWGGNNQLTATHSTWSANDGAPGIWSGFTNVDSATFGNSITSSAATISIISPVSIKNLAFNNTEGESYTIAAGTGGSLQLSSASGPATINNQNGVHTISAPVTLQSNVTITSQNAADRLTIAQLLQGGAGTQTVSKNGDGTVVFTGANTYTGATSISNGILNIQNAAALGTAAPGTTVSSGGTLQIQGGITVASEALNISGAGETGQTGALVNVSGTNTYAGPVTLGANATIASNAGTLNLTSATAIGGAGNTLVLGGAGNGTVSSSIATGTGGLTKTGTGTWVLSGENTYTGTTTISTGTLQVGNGGTTGTLGSASSTIANDGNLAINRSDAVTIARVIAGTGSLTQMGSGTTILTSDNSYGSTIISAGTLQVGNGGNSGTLGTGAVTNNSVLAVNRSDTYTISQGISGSGSLVQSGSGTTILTGTKTYSGTTTVQSGTLQLDGTIASATTVQNTATLSGSGTNNGTVTVALGGTISPGVGNSSSKLTTFGQIWQGGGKMDFDVAVMTGAGLQSGAGSNYDTLAITGALNLSGLSSGNRFTLAVDDQFSSGWNMLNDYQWLVAAADSIAYPGGYGPANINNLFAINLGLWSSPINTAQNGHFYVSSSGGNLYLNYSAVPEAGTAMLGVLALMPLLSHRRRRAVQPAVTA